MALMTDFGYTNVTPSQTKTVQTYDMDELHNYSKPKEYGSNDTTGYYNMTCPDNMPEVIQYFCRKLKKVLFPVKLWRPSRVKEGRCYGLRYTAVCATVDTEDPTYESDAGVQVEIRVAEICDPRITDNMVKAAFERAVSGFYKEDGTTRIPELRRGGTDLIAE